MENQADNDLIPTPWGRLRATDPRVWGGFVAGPSIEQMAEIGNAIHLGELSASVEGDKVTITSHLPGPPPEYGARRK